MTNPNIPHHTSSSSSYVACKAFVFVTPQMEDTKLYLEQAAYVEVYKRQVKKDDIQNALIHKANTVGVWTAKKLVE